MTKPRKTPSPAIKREHIGGDVMAYFRERAAADPEFAAASREETEKLELAHRIREAQASQVKPVEQTAAPERSSWTSDDILAIAKTLRVR